MLIAGKVTFPAETSTPPAPRWLYLDGGNASVSGARRISATEFEITITYSFTIGNDGYYFDWGACAKDTVSRDGLGLPGSHGCGARRQCRQTGCRDRALLAGQLLQISGERSHWSGEQ